LKNGIRLDALVVERGLAASRERARALILAGDVRVGGRPITKAGTAVPRDADITVAAPDHPYVGRGGLKLAHALDTFGVTVHGRLALDIGASTGGFTDVLLRHGAREVVAVDVGYGQLAWELRTDPRVTILDRTNIRELDPATLPYRPSLVTADLSFISLRSAIGSLVATAAPRADLVLLVKPQFEAGRDDVGPGGVVADPRVWRRVIDDVADAAAGAGAGAAAVICSPITGPAGNVEFLLHAEVGAPAVPFDVDGAIAIGRELAGA
jgi:23S rRNA (cytidine1920-2'-O)/16S rRNA (cytidine1409-2'-O)-methyltransferase